MTVQGKKGKTYEKHGLRSQQIADRLKQISAGCKVQAKDGEDEEDAKYRRQVLFTQYVSLNKVAISHILSNLRNDTDHDTSIRDILISKQHEMCREAKFYAFFQLQARSLPPR